MYAYRNREEQLARDDRAIRLRMAGLSYRQMALELGVKTAGEAMSIYRSARVDQIPEVIERTRPRPPDAVVAWAAGFFDGEGCIFGYEGRQANSRQHRFTFGLVLAQVVRDPLDVLFLWWGGAIRWRAQPTARQRDQWIWSARGLEAAWFLEDVLPHLRVKDTEARAAIPCLFRIHRRRTRFSDAEIAERRAAVAVLASAKTKGRRV